MVSWAPQHELQEQPSKLDFAHVAAPDHHGALFDAVCEQQVNNAMKFVPLHELCYSLQGLCD